MATATRDGTPRRLFRDRREAGRVVAELLDAYRDNPDVVVLGLARGGVPVAFEVATALRAPLDAYIVRKLGAPGHEEFAVGALASGGRIVLNDDVVRGLGVTPAQLRETAEREGRELERREAVYRAGRPPLEVKLRVTLNGTTEDVVVIVQHPKCCSDSASWQRRVNASNALKAYVDATWPTQKVWVIGDWNDDVDTSITTGSASPYANFVNDPARYTVVTKALSDAHIASTTGFPDTIDHHMGTNEVAATLVPGSVQVFRADAYVASYGTTTSDHYPVMSRYSFGGGTATPTVTVTAPNGGEQVVVGSAQTIRWSSSAVTDVRVELSTDGGATFSTIAASTPAAAGSLAWTVPATPSTAALIRVSDTASAATDRSDAAFAIVAAGGTANVVINEILANEPGSTTAGEFVELVNIGTAPADLSGWTLSDASAVRHTFPAGTTLAAGKAIVVFGGASGIPAGTPGAVAASTGSLSLGNSGDSVILKSGTTVISSFTYGSALAAQDGVSMNRSPDGGTAATYVLHNTLTALKASPGTRASGAAW